MTQLLQTLFGRLRDERGIALVMAVGVTTVLGVAATSVVLFTTSNESQTSRSRADLQAYTLAQGGINNAVAVLGKKASESSETLQKLIDPSIFETDPSAQTNTNPNDDATVGICTADPADCQATLENGAVAWTGQLIDKRSELPNGHLITTPLWVWRLTATGTVPNPAAGGTLSRTVKADVKLKPTTTQAINSEAWNYVYSKKNDNDPTTCDEVIYNNTSLRSPMYVNGDLCFQHSSQIIGADNPATDPDVELVVKGNVYINQPNAFIGYDKNPPQHVQPLDAVYIGGLCSSQANGTLHWPCTATDNIWVWKPGGPYVANAANYVPASTGGPTVPAPVAAYEDWYELASPGPKNPCDPTLSTVSAGGTLPLWDDPLVVGGVEYPPVRNWSRPTLNLTPATFSYHCETAEGYITWRHGTRTLEIDGTLFYDGSIEVNGIGAVDYTGRGAIYMTGSFFMRQSSLCGNRVSGVCSYDGWDYENNIIVLVTEGSGAPATTGMGITLDQSVFQGALYATTNIEITSSSNAQGPMVAEQEVIRNNSDTTDFPRFLRVPFGTPGNRVTTWELTAPVNYTG